MSLVPLPRSSLLLLPLEDAAGRQWAGKWALTRHHIFPHLDLGLFSLQEVRDQFRLEASLFGYGSPKLWRLWQQQMRPGHRQTCQGGVFISTPPTPAVGDPAGSAASAGCCSFPFPLANQNSDDNKSSPSSPYPLLLIELLLQFTRHAAEEALPSLRKRVVTETYSYSPVKGLRL